MCFTRQKLVKLLLCPFHHFSKSKGTNTSHFVSVTIVWEDLTAVTQVVTFFKTCLSASLLLDNSRKAGYISAEVELLHYGIGGHLKCLWQQKKELSPKCVIAHTKNGASEANWSKQVVTEDSLNCEWEVEKRCTSISLWLHTVNAPLLRWTDSGRCSAPADVSCSLLRSVKLSIKWIGNPQGPYGILTM